MSDSIFDLIARSNLKEIEDYLNNGGNVNGVIYQGQSPLLYALKFAEHNSNGNDIIMSLLGAGADSTFRNQDNCTALMTAINYRRSIEVQRVLVDLETDFNAVNAFNMTVLQCACRFNCSLDIVKKIIKKGCMVNRDNYGCPPLYFDTDHIRCEPDIIMELIGAGADIHASNKVAVNKYHRNLLMCINCDGSCEYDGYQCKYKKIIDSYLDSGVDIRQTVRNGNTVIHMVACKYLISLAVKQGVSVDVKNNDGVTPLVSAMLAYDYKKIKTLLYFGSDPNCLNQVVEEIISYGRIVNILLYHGAELSVEVIKTLIPKYLYYDNIKMLPQSEFGALLKNVILFCGENILDDSYSDFIHKIKIFEFLNDCKKELNWMKKMFIKDGLNFYEFCCLKRLKTSKFVDISIQEYNYNSVQIKSMFPNYYDIIMLRIRDNQVKRSKNILLNCLENINILPLMVTETGSLHNNASSVCIGFDCLYKICQYLNHNQLYNVFLSAIHN